MKQINEIEIVGGHYQIVNQIGQGGFGRTYLAIDKHSMDHYRAIKVFEITVSDDLEQKALELFEREAKSLSRLTKERTLRTVPSFFAYFNEENKFYIVQEYINGKNLEEILKEKGAFTEAEVRDIVLSVLETLKVVHGLGIIHRDVKPANLMKRNTDRSIVLVDFGAVKETIQNRMGKKKPATHIWTEGYAPNEQMNGQPVLSSDIYALGVTAINLLTNKHPNQWKNPSPSEMVGYLVDIELICKDFSEILGHMVEKDVANRYENVNDPIEKLSQLQSTILANVQPVRNFNWNKATGLLVCSGFLSIAFLVGWGIGPLLNNSRKNGEALIPPPPSSPSPSKPSKNTPASPSSKEDLPIKFR